MICWKCKVKMLVKILTHHKEMLTCPVCNNTRVVETTSGERREI